MGMGEPLLNLDALLPALAAAADRDGLGISARRITISTVGLPEGIRRLARENCQYHLAVSLHAANDSLRNEIVPANRGFRHRGDSGGGRRLLRADRPPRHVRVRVALPASTIGRSMPRQLVKLLRGRPALVNLIPYNPVAGLPYRTPPSSVTARFVETSTQGGLNVAIRHRKGDRIAAACGQLRRRSVRVVVLNLCYASLGLLSLRLCQLKGDAAKNPGFVFNVFYLAGYAEGIVKEASVGFPVREELMKVSTQAHVLHGFGKRLASRARQSGLGLRNSNVA